MQNTRLTTSDGGFTPVPNSFIDSCMVRANGEYIKVYLFLLKNSHAGDTDITISGIADCLEMTDNDIVRALRYLENEGALKTETDESGAIISVDFLQDGGEPREEISTSAVSADSDEFRDLLLSAEKYFGRTLRATDTEILLNMLNNLHFSYDMIDYLLCYAVEKDKKSMRYVEATGLAWLDEGITTVSAAKEHLKNNNDVVSCVMKAFGLQKRSPATQEMDFIIKWKDDFGFNTDIILEACNRTMSALSNPSFQYADRILSNWFDKGIKDFDDIKRLDDEFNASIKGAKTAPKKKSTVRHATKFHNFEQRNIDFDELERRIAENNTKKYGDT